MADSPESPTPDDAPLSVGDDEVERLLKEAESLTAEIAEDAGVDPDAASGTTGQDRPGGEGEDRPDPVEAAAKAEEAAKDLGDLLRDSDAQEAARAAEPSSPSSPVEATPDTKLAPPPPEQGSGDDGGFSDLTDDDHAAFESAAGGGAKLAQSGDVDDIVPEDVSGEGGEETPGAGETPSSEQIAWRVRCLRRSKSAVSWLRKAPKIVPAAMQAAIIWMDRPFAGVRPGVKRFLGVIALASILTGIAAWVLPGALEHNQFAEMPTDTAVDAPAFRPSEE